MWVEQKTEPTANGVASPRIVSSPKKKTDKEVVMKNLVSRQQIQGLFLAVILAVGIAGPARAQVTASVSGRVEDATGAIVPGAMVTVASLETGAARTATASAAGTYRVLSLPVGQYEVRATAAGFKAVVQTGISLVVGEEAVVNLKLEVGAVQEQVTVTGEAPLVNTTTSSVSGLVGERQVKDLPLNGRSFDNLITLNPGAVNYSLKAGASIGSGEGAYFTVAGRRPLDNIFLLNGIEYTGASNIGITPGGVSGQLLGIDAVREFNVLSDTYSAEYGKHGGAQVSVVTQSGSNQLHGALFEFLRNNKLDARNFFDATIGAPPFKRNQFGASLGGPIKRDKMFLFGNWEAFRQRLAVSNVAFVPDDNARQGMLPCNIAYTAANWAANCTGGLNAAVRAPNLDTRMLRFMALWPQSNGPEQVAKNLATGKDLVTGVAKNFNNPLQKIREDFGTARFDLNVSEKDTFTSAYTLDDGDNTTPLTNPFFGTIAYLQSQVASAQETHVFSPRLLNTVRAGFSRGAFNFDSTTLVPLPPDITLFAGKPPGPMSIGGASAAAVGALTPAGAGIAGRIFNYRNLFTGADDVQLVRGKHQLSFGGWFQRIQVNANSAARSYGEAQFASLLGFLQGITTQFAGVPNRTFMYWRSIEGAWYVQDVIQLRPNFTVRLGVRDEFTNGWNEKYGRAAQYVPDASGILTSDPETSTTHIGGASFLDNKATKLFAPRVGIAWDPFGDGKTSIRAGFGMFYTLLDNLSFQMNFTPPFNTPFAYQNVSLPPLLPIIPGKPLPPFCRPGLTTGCTTPLAQGTQVNPKTPAVISWNYSIERQLTRNMSLRVAYIGSHGYHNIIDIDNNTVAPQLCSNPSGCLAGGVRASGMVPPGTQYFPRGPRPNPYLASGYQWYMEGINSYNALQADLTKRFSGGLSFRANYTFSKNMDDGTGIASSQSQNQNQSVLDPRHPLRDYGRSALDFRHQGSGSFNYELPFGNGKRLANGLTGIAGKLASGWQVNGILTLLSGFPFTPLVGTNQSGNGNQFSPDRPNLSPNFQGPLYIRSVDQWFDPNAFSLPLLGTWGDVGRGVLQGPGLAELDFSVFKTTHITERTSMLFRAEFFNITNRANFNVPNFLVFSGGSISPSAAKITSTTTSSRQIQFGLKLVF
jgi:hypothetical protein